MTISCLTKIVGQSNSSPATSEGPSCSIHKTDDTLASDCSRWVAQPPFGLDSFRSFIFVSDSPKWQSSTNSHFEFTQPDSSGSSLCEVHAGAYQHDLTKDGDVEANPGPPRSSMSLHVSSETDIPNTYQEQIASQYYNEWPNKVDMVVPSVTEEVKTFEADGTSSMKTTTTKALLMETWGKITVHEDILHVNSGVNLDFARLSAQNDTFKLASNVFQPLLKRYCLSHIRLILLKSPHIRVDTLTARCTPVLARDFLPISLRFISVIFMVDMGEDVEDMSAKCAGQARKGAASILVIDRSDVKRVSEKTGLSATHFHNIEVAGTDGLAVHGSPQEFVAVVFLPPSLKDEIFIIDPKIRAQPTLSSYAEATTGVSDREALDKYVVCAPHVDQLAAPLDLAAMFDAIDDQRDLITQFCRQSSFHPKLDSDDPQLDEIGFFRNTYHISDLVTSQGSVLHLDQFANRPINLVNIQELMKILPSSVQDYESWCNPYPDQLPARLPSSETTDSKVLADSKKFCAQVEAGLSVLQYAEAVEEVAVEPDLVSQLLADLTSGVKPTLDPRRLHLAFDSHVEQKLTPFDVADFAQKWFLDYTFTDIHFQLPIPSRYRSLQGFQWGAKFYQFATLIPSVGSSDKICQSLLRAVTQWCVRSSIGDANWNENNILIRSNRIIFGFQKESSLNIVRKKMDFICKKLKLNFHLNQANQNDSANELEIGGVVVTYNNAKASPRIVSRLDKVAVEIANRGVSFLAELAAVLDWCKNLLLVIPELALVVQPVSEMLRDKLSNAVADPALLQTKLQLDQRLSTYLSAIPQILKNKFDTPIRLPMTKNSICITSLIANAESFYAASHIDSVGTEVYMEKLPEKLQRLRRLASSGGHFVMLSILYLLMYKTDVVPGSVYVIRVYEEEAYLALNRRAFYDKVSLLLHQCIQAYANVSGITVCAELCKFDDIEAVDVTVFSEGQHVWLKNDICDAMGTFKRHMSDLGKPLKDMSYSYMLQVFDSFGDDQGVAKFPSLLEPAVDLHAKPAEIWRRWLADDTSTNRHRILVPTCPSHLAAQVHTLAADFVSDILSQKSIRLKKLWQRSYVDAHVVVNYNRSTEEVSHSSEEDSDSATNLPADSTASEHSAQVITTLSSVSRCVTLSQQKIEEYEEAAAYEEMKRSVALTDKNQEPVAVFTAAYLTDWQKDNQITLDRDYVQQLISRDNCTVDGQMTAEPDPFRFSYNEKSSAGRILNEIQITRESPWYLLAKAKNLPKRNTDWFSTYAGHTYEIVQQALCNAQNSSFVGARFDEILTNQQTANYTAQLAAKDAEIAQLKKLNGELSIAAKAKFDTAHRLEMQIATQKNSMTRLKDELASSQKLRIAAQADVVKFKASSDKLRQANDELTIRIQESEDRVEKHLKESQEILSKQLDDQLSKNKSAANKAVILRGDNAQLDKQVRQLTIDLKKARLSIEMKENSNKSLKTSIKSLEKTYREGVEKLNDQLGTASSELALALEAHALETKDFKSQLRDVISCRDHLEKQNETNVAQLKRLRKELDVEQQRSRDFQSTNDSNLSRNTLLISSLSMELKQKKRDLDLQEELVKSTQKQVALQTSLRKQYAQELEKRNDTVKELKLDLSRKKFDLLTERQKLITSTNARDEETKLKYESEIAQSISKVEELNTANKLLSDQIEITKAQGADTLLSAKKQLEDAMKVKDDELQQMKVYAEQHYAAQVKSNEDKDVVISHLNQEILTSKNETVKAEEDPNSFVLVVDNGLSNMVNGRTTAASEAIFPLWQDIAECAVALITSGSISDKALMLVDTTLRIEMIRDTVKDQLTAILSVLHVAGLQDHPNLVMQIQDTKKQMDLLADKAFQVQQTLHYFCEKINVLATAELIAALCIAKNTIRLAHAPEFNGTGLGKKLNHFFDMVNTFYKLDKNSKTLRDELRQICQDFSQTSVFTAEQLYAAAISFDSHFSFIGQDYKMKLDTPMLKKQSLFDDPTVPKDFEDGKMKCDPQQIYYLAGQVTLACARDVCSQVPTNWPKLKLDNFAMIKSNDLDLRRVPSVAKEETNYNLVSRIIREDPTTKMEDAEEHDDPDIIHLKSDPDDNDFIVSNDWGESTEGLLLDKLIKLFVKDEEIDPSAYGTTTVLLDTEDDQDDIEIVDTISQKPVRAPPVADDDPFTTAVNILEFVKSDHKKRHGEPFMHSDDRHLPEESFLLDEDFDLVVERL